MQTQGIPTLFHLQRWSGRVLLFLTLTTVMCCIMAADLSRIESFDTSGMPRRPTNFLEQQILDLIASHHRGDLADAARIQGKLGRYYAEKGDEERSRSAFLLGAAAKDALENGNKETSQMPPQESTEITPKEEARMSGERTSAASRFSGKYFGYEGRMLHTWEFDEDGTFLHTCITSGAGTNTRASEKGRFRLADSTLELKMSSAASGFTTPGVGGNRTNLGGNHEVSSETRKLDIQFLSGEKAIILGGVKLKPKSW